MTNHVALSGKHNRRYQPGTNDPTSDFGHTWTTQRASSEVNEDDASHALRQHLHAFWGECSPEVFQNGDFAIAHGVLRLTVHFDRHGVKFGIVTKAPNLDTTVFMPDET